MKAFEIKEMRENHKIIQLIVRCWVNVCVDVFRRLLLHRENIETMKSSVASRRRRREKYWKYFCWNEQDLFMSFVSLSFEMDGGLIRNRWNRWMEDLNKNETEQKKQNKTEQKIQCQCSTIP